MEAFHPKSNVGPVLYALKHGLIFGSPEPSAPPRTASHPG
jgi:hypothetical protein